MATYHLRLKVLSRKLKAVRPGGPVRRSAVAAAAYRSGERLYDVALDRWFEYHKPDVVHTEIMIPAGVEAPVWANDRQALWNAVEASEKRVDAQLYREVEISIPRELSPEQRVALVQNFVRDTFVDLGMVADIAIHCPPAADGREQPHAHVLLALRRVDASTPTGFSTHKEREWNERSEIADLVARARKRFNNTGLDEDRDALKAAEAQRNVRVWRKAWADYANNALASAGSTARVDHRTLLEQGIERAAQISLGIARHIEKAYDYIKERVVNFVAIRQRAKFYEEAEYIRNRDPTQLGEMMVMMQDMAERFAAQFRKPPDDHEVPHER